MRTCCGRLVIIIARHLTSKTTVPSRSSTSSPGSTTGKVTRSSALLLCTFLWQLPLITKCSAPVIGHHGDVAHVLSSKGPLPLVILLIPCPCSAVAPTLAAPWFRNLHGRQHDHWWVDGATQAR